MTLPVPRPIRLLIALAIGAYWAHTVAGQVHEHRDFGQMWYAARTVLAGGNPYRVIGPGLLFDWPWPWYYPLTAAFPAMPLASFSEATAVAVMVFASASAFAWAVMATGYWPLLAFLSGGAWQALLLGQWSPLLAASVVITPLAFLLAAKPTLGLAFFVARPSWYAVAGALMLGGLAFAVDPGWVTTWLETIRHGAIRPGFQTTHAPPISYWGGPLILAALTRWRRPEARLLVALACVPQTTLPHEMLPLFLVTRGWQSGFLLASSWAMFFFVNWVRGPGMASTVSLYGQAFVLFLYLPLTLFVLRRPNEGVVPAWIEARLSSVPRYLKLRTRVN